MHILSQSKCTRPVHLLTLASCLLIFSPSQHLHAHENSSAESDAEMVAPFVNETTILVLKIDLNAARLPDSGGIESPLLNKTAIQFANQVMQQGRAIVGDRPIYATVGIPVSTTRIPVFAFVEEQNDSTELVRLLNNVAKVNACVHKGYVVAALVGKPRMEETLRALPPTSREDVATAFKTVADYPVQALLLPPGHVRRTVEELMPQLPPQLGGGPSSVLTEGVIWAAFGLAPDRLNLEVTIQSQDEQAAAKFAAHLPEMLRALYNSIPSSHQPLAKQRVNDLLNSVKPKVVGDQIKVTFAAEKETRAQGLGLLGSVAASMRARAQRQTNMNRMKQMVLALHNYHDVYRMFPPREKYRNEQGKHQLSWRVHILPFVEQTELYKKFKLDEPWDSPHNKPLLQQMPEIFSSKSPGPAGAAALKPGHTTFVAPQGEDTVLGGDEKSRIQDCRDGTSNTIVLVHVKPELAVPWTAPDDYAFASDDPAAGLRTGSDGRWLAAFADGSVRTLPDNIKPETILRLFQKSDGGVISWDEIR
jgi:hypothetical protein